MASDDRVTGTQFGVGVVTPTSPRSGAISKPLSQPVAVPVVPHQAGADLVPGTLVAGKYELIRELGRGGMGVVYAARDLKLGRRVAMKFLRHVDEEVLDRFLIEARATAQCNHDNIVIIYEVDSYAGMPYMVLEYLEGKSLRDFMGPFGNGDPMPASRVVELILPVARALARAAELGIVHRDLKPENVLVTHNGGVKVLDFGIAKALGTDEVKPRLASQSGSSRDMTLTREGAMIGTLPYMSPEQMGMDHIDHRSDLFSLGLIMFEMLTGEHPVTPLSADGLTQNLINPSPMRSVKSLAPDAPEPLAKLIDDALKKRKHERVASATEVVRRLEQLLPGRGGRQLAEGESPFPGLTAFQEADADRFFGRSRDIARMVARVRELPLTGIVGPSGVGKSSFIRAGVGPALKASGEHWDVVTLRPGRQPLAALASIVERFTTRMMGRAQSEPGDHQRLIDRLRTEPGYLGSLLRTRAQSTRSHLLLFVDQFEELYTLVTDPAERKAFTAALAAVADDTAAPLRVVVSMRSDFLDRVGEDARFLEELSRGLVFLSAPDRSGLREALVSPLEMVGYELEGEQMIDHMLDELAGTSGALPLLQFAASKLWDARDRERKLLTIASYEAIGGITGALATHADEIVRNMNANAQRLTQKVFRQLVTSERTRAIVELSELQQLSTDKAELSRVIDLLVAARLLVVQTRGDASSGGTVEIVHESLIDRWPMLRRWLDEDQEDAAFLQDLAAAAKQWDTKGRPPGMLWRGDAMLEARRWYTSRPRSLPPREQAFIDAVLALDRRTTRTRRILLGAAFSVLATFGVVATIGYVRVRSAEENARTSLVAARENEKRATDALDAKRAEEAARKQAEGKALTAEEQRAAEEKARLEAEASKVATEKLSREQLEAKNAELEASLRDSKSARDRAEAASKKAEAAAAEAKRLQAELAEKLKAEQARVKQLQDEMKKISTQLKE